MTPEMRTCIQLGLNSSGDQASQPNHGITINLLDKNLWKIFDSTGNEMIVLPSLEGLR
jgi:hypothetical protein